MSLHDAYNRFDDPRTLAELSVEDFHAELEEFGMENVWRYILALPTAEDLEPFKNFVTKYGQTTEGSGSELVLQIQRMLKAKETVQQLGDRISDLSDKSYRLDILRSLKVVFVSYDQNVYDNPILEEIERFNEQMQNRYQFNLIFDLEPVILEVARSEEAFREAQENVEIAKQKILILAGKEPDPEGPKVYESDLNKTVKSIAQETNPDYPETKLARDEQGNFFSYTEEIGGAEKIKKYDEAAKEQLKASLEQDLVSQQQALKQLEVQRASELAQKRQTLRIQLTTPLQHILEDLPLLVDADKVEKVAGEITRFQDMLGVL